MRVKLMIVYPYGLKDWLGNEYKKDNTQVLVGNKFPPLLRTQNKVSRGLSHKRNNSLSPDEFLTKT